MDKAMAEGAYLFRMIYEDRAAELARQPEGTMSQTTKATECDLCGDQGPLLLAARCHMTAPLSAELNVNMLILRCYIPECRREVARFTIDRNNALPDLLDALRGFLHADPDVFRDELAAARAAIRKATGE